MTEQEDIKMMMEATLNTAMHSLPAIIEHKHVSSEESDTGYIENYLITCEYGNCKHTHNLMLVFDIETCEFGIDLYSHDGDIAIISPVSIMTQLYFDLTLKGLNEEHM